MKRLPIHSVHTAPKASMARACTVLAFAIVVAGAPATRRVEPTPANWKELREEQKYDYLARNYGVARPKDTGETGEPGGFEAARWASATPAVSHNLGPVRRASEVTSVDWKTWSEADKFNYLHRNYGVSPP